jgi:hypothetical protein
MKTLITLIIAILCVSADANPVGAAAALINMKQQAKAAKQAEHVAKFKAAVALYRKYRDAQGDSVQEIERDSIRAYAAFSCITDEWHEIKQEAQLAVLLDADVQKNINVADAPDIKTVALMRVFLKWTYVEIDYIGAYSVSGEMPTLCKQVKAEVRTLAATYLVPVKK